MTASGPGGAHEFLHPDEYRAWNALLKLQQTSLRALDAALRVRAGLSVSEFDVLITLYNAPEWRLGMTALAQSVAFSPSGLTHLVTRLERSGLVERVVDPEDGRKFYTVLTGAGDDCLRAARPVHNEVLRAVLLSHLGAGDRRALAELWERVREG
ncbi:MAG TPA: MarR family transcriptional regulator [Actinomycetota bacterium]|nr:MarR family transcriptional regulator [Actinomycetota bacterium]